MFPIDLAYIDTAIVLGVGGLFVHWVKRINSLFEKLEHLRYEHERRLLVFEAELKTHIEVSEEVWENVGRRLNHLESNGRLPRQGN